METLRFTLRTNELLVALRTLRVKTILGLPVDPYAEMQPDEEIDSLSDGIHRLFHVRGLYEALMDPSNTQHAKALTILAALHVCAFCTTSLVANHRSVENKESWLAWHRELKFDPLIVQYRQKRENRHAFSASLNPDVIYSSLTEFLPQTEVTAKGQAISMSAADWELLHNDSPRSKNITAKRFSFVKTMLKETNHFWCSTIDYSASGSRVSKELSLLYSPKRLWLLDETPGAIHVIPCTTSELKERIRKLVEAFTTRQ